tara:strand:- start:63 stop:1700 length:1638 start_codon:yes stop_codon:yes gene_type:complete
MDQFGQFNYVGVGVTRGLHSSTPAIFTGNNATYQKVASNNVSSVVVNYGAESYNLDMSDIFIDIGVGIGSVGIRSDTQIIINTPSTENPNVQVGDIVDFDRSNGSLNDQVSRVVGVGTYYFIIEDNIDPQVSSASGNCTVEKLETFLPTGIGATGNYRGAIVMNDSNNVSGDFDDFVLRCHSANISGSNVTSFNYENNGAIYGPLVTGEDEQTGLRGYIFGKDGIEGNDADADGGIGKDSNFKRLSNTFYRYSIPSIQMRHINGGNRMGGTNYYYPNYIKGKYSFGVNNITHQYNPFVRKAYNRIYLNLTDADGTYWEDFFKFTVGRDSIFGSSLYPNPTLWNFKITSLDTKSSVDIYSSERPYMWCKIIDPSGGTANGSINADNPTPGVQGYNSIVYNFEVIASNINLTSDTENYSDGTPPYEGTGSPDNADDFGGAVNGTNSSLIEWFKCDSPTNGDALTFHASCSAGENVGMAFASQKVHNNEWTHIVKEFQKSNLNPSSGDERLANITHNILPNLDYRVWNYATNTLRPYLKIINHPKRNT